MAKRPGATAIRVPNALAHRADRLQVPLLERLLAEQPTEVPRVSRSAVVTEALRRGLSALEREAGLDVAPVPEVEA